MLNLKKVRKHESKKKRVHGKEQSGLFSQLITIIRKNVRLIIRSKSSSLIVLLGPLLIIALVGTAYNTSNIYDIRVGAYSESYSELAESILEELGSKQFSVIRLDSKEECIASLKSAEIHVCALIPADLETGGSEPIDFQVDQSRVNLVWIIIDAVSSKVSSKTTELSLQLTSSVLGAITDSLEKIQGNQDRLGVLQSSNDEVEGSVNDAVESLSAIDFDLVGEIDLGKISQRLDEIIDANNLTSSNFDPVKQTISRIKNNTESVGESLSESTAGALENLQGASSNLGESSASINDLVSTIESIKTQMETATGISAESIVTPVKTRVTPIVAEKTHLSFLFPTLVVLVIMLMALILSSSTVIREKTSTAFFRNYISPVKDGVFILGNFLTNFLIIALQLLVVFIVAAMFFRGALFSVLWKVVLILLPVIAVFILVGMLIGYLFRTEETSMLATISVGSLFLFFSSTILPLETLPRALKQIADFNPFVLSEGVLKKIMLFKVEFVGILEPLSVLLVYIVLLAILVFYAQKFSKARH